MNTAEIQALNDAHIINTYGARKLAIARGEGATIWDADGREYLDCFAGIAVCNLGHCHPAVTAAIRHVPFKDIAALDSAVTPEVGAVLIEPIQGEGGVRMPADGYLRAVRDLCDARGILLIFDEVQTGLGRTGPLFAHQDFGVQPDIMTLAKGLANGVPIGAMGCTDEVAQGFSPGAHACTFGGNPLSCAAAIATLETLTSPGFLENAKAVGDSFIRQLKALAAEHPQIVEVRGKGLMIGIEFKEPVAPLIARMIESGVICGPAGPNVLRFLPPLIITAEQTERVVSVLSVCLGELGW